jgi:hypothetical protein
MIDPSERIRELLNYSGYPFQHHCADRISRLDQYQLSAEVPFTHPSTNGPLLGVHGTIDLLAARPDRGDDILLCFVIECKKANDKTKNWILLPNKQQSPRWPVLVFSQLPPDGREQLGVTRSLMFPELGYKRGSQYDYCINGIEVNTALTHANQDKGEKIYNPLRQVLHGSRAFEAADPKIVEGIEYFRENKHRQRVYVPVVITTANIYVVDFPLDRVAQGEVASGDLTLGEARRWATYEFPLPDYLSYQVARGDGEVFVNKRTVFIVNDKAIDEFFSKVVGLQNFDGTPAE